MELSHGLDDPQPGPHRPLGIIFVRQGVAEVDQEAIAEVLGDMPLKAGDHLGAGVLIGPHHLAQLFRVELARQARRVHQITEQHGELPAFGLRRRRCGWEGRSRRARGHPGWRAETALSRPHQHRAVLVHRELFDLNQLHLEVGQILVIEGELALEGAIGGPALALQDLDDAGEHGIEVHHRSS